MKGLKKVLSLIFILMFSCTMFFGCGEKAPDTTESIISLTEAKKIVETGTDATYNKYHKTKAIAALTGAEGHNVFDCFKTVEFSGYADLATPYGPTIDYYKTLMENVDGEFTKYTVELSDIINGEEHISIKEYFDGQDKYCYYALNEEYTKNDNSSTLGPDHSYVQFALRWLNTDSYDQMFKQNVKKITTNDGYSLVFDISLETVVTYCFNWDAQTVADFMDKYGNPDNELYEYYQACYSKLVSTLTIQFNNNNEFLNFELHAKGQELWDKNPENFYDMEFSQTLKPSSAEVSEPDWFKTHTW